MTIFVVEPGIAAELCVCVVAQNLELGNCIDWRLKNKASIDRTHIIGAVDHEIVRFRPLAIDGIRLVLPCWTSSFQQSGRQRHYAGLKSSQLRKVTAIQRQVENLVLHHRLPEAAHRALHQCSIRAYVHLLCFSSELEMDGDDRAFVDVQTRFPAAGIV